MRSQTEVSICAHPSLQINFYFDKVNIIKKFTRNSYTD